MKPCKICGSHAINPHLHDRVPGEDLDLCDVCYWRARALEARRLCVTASLPGMSLGVKKRAAELEGWHGLFEEEEGE